MIRLYAPDIENDELLPEVESGHCCRVLRMHAGDSVNVVDGKGHVFECEIVDANPRHTAVRILEKYDEPLYWSPRITLAVAPTKNMDRMEWLAEKAVEIGIDRLVFLICAHSIRKIVKCERIEKILVSAMKQSLKSMLPEFSGMVDFATFVGEKSSAVKYMGYCDDTFIRREFAKEYDGVSDVTILIGPEGDFTEQEVRMAIDNGFNPVTFGNTRLRTETAALYSLCATHTIITQK